MKSGFSPSLDESWDSYQRLQVLTREAIPLTRDTEGSGF